jgi:hypothetical protein
MNYARIRHTASTLNDGRVLVTGGTNLDSDSNTAELYDPSTGIWTTTRSMNEERDRHTAAVLKDGRVLVTGGTNFNDSINTAEWY